MLAVLVLVLYFVATTAVEISEPLEDYAGGDSVNDTILDDLEEEIPIFFAVNVTELPACSDDELVIFDGVDLDCIPIPDRECRCPGPVIMNTTGEPTALPGPPLGCTVFDPPAGGAFVCVLTEEGLQIYCSVLCDDQSEFTTFPLNPYSCGIFTSFKWKDFSNRTLSELPQCSAQRTFALYNDQFYLPGSCGDLSVVDFERVMTDFCLTLEYTFFFVDCVVDDVFIQCGN